MAGNATAEMEQLLAELVRLTTKIAAMTNEAQNKSTNDPDSLTSTANRLALSATIIAVAAFFIAALQAVLEYASAGESARRKCNKAAIGPFSKKVRKKWSFRSWRQKFYYPEVSITLKDPRPVNGGEDGGLLRRGSQTVINRSLPISGNEINVVENARRVSRPRATWAQFLVWDDQNYGTNLTTGRYIDVDSVPSSLDVPVQMVDLIQLGRLCILMGYDVVRMSFRDRSFSVTGEMGTITIEELVGFGKAIRYQGNGFNRHKGIDLSSPWVKDSSFLIDGLFDTPNGLLHSPIPEREKYIRHMLKTLRSEANRMRTALNKRVNDYDDRCFDGSYEGVSAIQNADTDEAFVQSRDLSDHLFYPDILVKLSKALFPRGETGFPARRFLLPFFGQCRRMSQAIGGDYVLEDGRGIATLYPRLFDRVKEAKSENASHWGSRDNIIPRSFDNKLGNTEQVESELQRWKVILPMVCDLFKDYNPRLWARYLQRNHYGNNPTPKLILITQLVLLDHYVYRSLQILYKTSMPRTAPAVTYSIVDDSKTLPGDIVDDVVTAIREAAKEGAKELPLFHNLEKMLLRYYTNLGSRRISELRYKHHISQIADMLKMRVLVYAAYLMIIPDSSDIIEAQDATGCKGFFLPMI